MKRKYEELKRATLKVLNLRNELIGTAWLIQDNKRKLSGYIITCRHVIFNRLDDNVKLGLTVQFHTSVDDTQNCYPVEVVFQDKDNDLALLKIKDDNVFKKVKNCNFLSLGNYSDIHEGESVLNVSHPYPNAYVVEEGKITGTTGDCGQGASLGYNRYRTNIKIDKGSSGSAVYNRYSGVLGIMAQIVEYNKYGIVIPCSAIEVFLDKYLESAKGKTTKCLDLVESYKDRKSEIFGNFVMMLIFFLAGQYNQFKFYYDGLSYGFSDWFCNLLNASNELTIVAMWGYAVCSLFFVYAWSNLMRNCLILGKQVTLIRFVYYLIAFSMGIIPLISAFLQSYIFVLLILILEIFGKKKLLKFIFLPKI